MLLPALSRARETTKKIACASNLKQITTYCTMYSSEFNDLMPGSGNVTYGPPSSWTSSLYGYIPGNPSVMMPTYPKTVFGNKILICSSNRSSRFSSYGPVVGYSTSYGMCAGGMRSSTATPSPALCKITQMKNPSAIPYWGEIDNSQYAHCIVNDVSASTLGYKYNLYSDIHRRQSNIAFSDGHVKSVSSFEWASVGSVGHPWGYHFAIKWGKPSW